MFSLDRFRRAVRPFGRAALTAAVAITAAGAVALPARADFCPTQFRDEADLLAVSESCRETYLLNAGVGNLASRRLIWDNRTLYRSLGFNDDFLSWARVELVTITADSPDMWGHCTDTTRKSHEPCPEDAVRYTRVADNFSQLPVTLHAIRHDDAVIYLGCGNDGDRDVHVPAPAPTLVGTKFDDANGNKVRNPGEAGVAGVQVTLVRESSLADEPPGPVATAVTGPDGRYAFDMHGRRPGVYRVDETVPAGWRQTTAASPRIALDWGAGDGEILLDDIGNRRIADVAKVGFEVLSAPARLEIRTDAEFVVRAVVSNLGPFPSVVATDRLDVVPPADCTATVLDPVRPVTLRVGEPVTLDFRVRTNCAHRSNHEWTFRDTLDPAADYEDPDPSNNTASTSIVRPVFEQLDLSVADPHVTCTRPTSPTRYECTVTAVVSNGLAATPVATQSTTTLRGAPDCLVSAPVTTDLVLRSVASAPVSAGFVAECGPGAHTFLGTVEVTEVEDHGEESDPADNVTRVHWVQTDVKPNSDPSSINLDKIGVVPVAILSAPGFDAVAEVVVDRGTLRFGATGTERSLVGCATGGEDVNGDGLLDLVCRFDTALTGFDCQSTLGRLTGVLRDGTPFESQDPVKITPCRRT